ncbi:MAG: Hpt domain-containing protein, partial [Candidatus Hadarchaeota archaeon]
MDDEYVEVFVEESKSLLTDLNNLLLELEEEPDNVDVMTSIFRNAHTLKGNSAAMGFDNLSETAHAIEDLLDTLRQGETQMDDHIMNLIFEGVDMIELLLGEIVESGGTTTQPGELISRIRSRLEDKVVEGTDYQDLQTTPGSQDSQESEPTSLQGVQENSDQENDHADDRVKLKIKVNPGSQMKGI